MLFNSFSFLFLYLPLVLAGYLLLARWRPGWIAAWLALASLFFYGYWDSRYLMLLLASIVANYCCGLKIAGASPAHQSHRRNWLCCALAVNLLLLAYYKYANFFVDNLGRALGEPLLFREIVLPVGISFFTFTQIAFLVDCYRGLAGEYRLVHYTLFVSYFPHLIAGPVLHHREMMPQFARQCLQRPQMADMAIGLSIFIVGLCKKVLLADPLSVLVAPVFAPGAQPQLVEAWTGALAYTLQLYFDFSGYSDMAIGLSRLFGIRLPLNFHSPYQAANISEFWRRWHMTLSRFLRDYLYLPLGGNRHGAVRRYRNLMLTMLLGGLWHGAGWTFVAWGALHGVYLVIHHAWQAWQGNTAPRWWARGLTFLAVLLAWVVFRAPDMATAGDILHAMTGANGISLPRAWAPHFAPYAAQLQLIGWQPLFAGIRWIDVSGIALPTLVVAWLLAWYAPNTQQIFHRYGPAIEDFAESRQRWPWRYQWTPSRRWSVVLTLLFLCCAFSMNRVSEFLYFQF